MIPKRPQKASEYGDRTALIAYLSNKTLRFHKGYYAGRNENKHKLSRLLARNQAEYLGGDYLLGFKFGRTAQKIGIKKAIREAQK